ncbi:MAG: hypothetical protein H6713_14275 [Myxococcales bacterium]|nr:hypothetical protein [Myxococcales bacterium]MCB9751140.1 hypothetical protein [Myxococcales bacterium]
MARLAVFEHGYGPLQRLLLSVIRRLVGYVPDPILVMSYRRVIFGRQFAPLLHRAMRKSKHWTVAEVEVMAAWVAKNSGCEY